MSSDLLVDLHDDLGGDDSPSAALDQLKLVQSKQWPPDDPVSLSKSGECPRSCVFVQHDLEISFILKILFSESNFSCGHKWK